MQLAAAKNTETSEDDYLAVVRGKTAELFGRRLRGGRGGFGQRPKGEQGACRSYGMNWHRLPARGRCAGLCGSHAKLGKNVGDDFREGKITLPVLLAFRRGDAEERAFWKQCLETRGEASDENLAHAIGLLTKHRRSPTPSSVPATMAPWPRMPSPCSRPAMRRTRWPKPWTSASPAPTERRGFLSHRRMVARTHQWGAARAMRRATRAAA